MVFLKMKENNWKHELSMARYRFSLKLNLFANICLIIFFLQKFKDWVWSFVHSDWWLMWCVEWWNRSTASVQGFWKYQNFSLYICMRKSDFIKLNFSTIPVIYNPIRSCVWCGHFQECFFKFADWTIFRFVEVNSF